MSLRKKRRASRLRSGADHSKPHEHPQADMDVVAREFGQLGATRNWPTGWRFLVLHL